MFFPPTHNGGGWVEICDRFLVFIVEVKLSTALAYKMGDQQTFEPVGEDAAYGNGGYADANGGAQQSFARKQCPGYV